jgi:hypothetical protein
VLDQQVEEHADATASQQTAASINRLNASIEFSNLMQSTLGWVAGCAWTDVMTDLFPALGSSPSLGVILANVGASSLLTLLALSYLVLTGDANAAVDLRNRAHVEKQFATGAMAFVAGWGWVLVIRDLFYPLGATLQGLLGHTIGQFVHFDPARVGQLLSVLLFAPSLTVFFFLAKHKTISAYAHSVAVRRRLMWNDAATCAVTHAELASEVHQRIKGRLDQGKFTLIVDAARDAQRRGDGPRRQLTKQKKQEPGEARSAACAGRQYGCTRRISVVERRSLDLRR